MYFELLEYHDELRALQGMVLLEKIVPMIERWFTYTVLNGSQYAEWGYAASYGRVLKWMAFLEFVFVI